MKNKKFARPSIAIAAAVIAVVSLSAVAFARPIWRQIQTTILEGQEYISEFTMKESEDGVLMGMTAIAENVDEMGRVVVEIDGEPVIIADPLVLHDLDEALSLFRSEDANILLPTYLPEGFEFLNATFTICPIRNSEQIGVGKQLFIFFGNEYESFAIEIRHNPEEFGFQVFWSLELTELTINGREAHKCGNGGLWVQATPNTSYMFMTWPMRFSGAIGSELDSETLIRIAESLQ